MTRIVIVSDRSLFGEGLVDLLRHQQGLDIVDHVLPSDALPGVLEESHPDVLFFGCTDPEKCPAPLFARSLRRGHVRRIICVHLEDNEVYVFHGERHTLGRVQDLVEAIAA